MYVGYVGARNAYLTSIASPDIAPWRMCFVTDTDLHLSVTASELRRRHRQV